MVDFTKMLAILLKQFPEIAEDLTDDDLAGLGYMQVACFMRYTQRQIDEGRKPELQRCFDTARRFMLEGDDELQNAMGVAYLEHLNLKDGKRPRRWALAVMPEPLRSEYSAIRGSDADIPGGAGPTRGSSGRSRPGAPRDAQHRRR